LAGEDYEIRFFNADGSVSHVVVTNCASDEDACQIAMNKYAEERKPFEIWRGKNRIACFSKPSEV